MEGLTSVFGRGKGWGGNARYSGGKQAWTDRRDGNEGAKRRPRVLVLGLSRGLGGGIERYVTSVEQCLESIPIAVERVDVYGSSKRKPLARLRFVGGTIAAVVLRRPACVLVMHGNLFAAAAIISRLTRLPWIGWIYGAEVFSAAGGEKVISKAKSAHAIVCISDFTLAMAMARSVRAMPRLTMMRPVLLESWWELVGEGSEAGSGRPCLVTVSRLDEKARYKGIDLVIDIVEDFVRNRTNVILKVIGDGDDLVRYRAEVAARGLTEWCRFLGPLSDKEMAEELRTAWAFVLPSTLEPESGGGEGFGIVYLEAASAGLPVVGSTHGGAREAVQDGVTGFTVDPEERSAVRSAIERLIEDPQLGRAMGSAGRKWVSEEFNITRMKREIAELLGQLPGGRGRRY